MSSARMTIEEAARHLNVSGRTVRSYIAQSLLTTMSQAGSRRKWLSPEEVEELRKDRVEGVAQGPGETRREMLELRAGFRRLRAEMDLVLRVLDMRETPLQLTPDRAGALYTAAVQELQGTGWTLAELMQWAEILLRIQEEDLRILHGAVGQVPWTPFLRLCVSMIAYVTTHESYKTDLDMQVMHRRLTEARRRLRISALCYSDMYGAQDAELKRAALFDSPASVRESLHARARAKGAGTAT